jgi:hypothetical protein
MPDWRALVRARLSNVGLEPVDEIDVTEEIAQLLEDRYRCLCEQGVPEAEAVELSLRELEGDDLVDGLTDALLNG